MRKSVSEGLECECECECGCENVSCEEMSGEKEGKSEEEEQGGDGGVVGGVTWPRARAARGEFWAGPVFEHQNKGACIALGGSVRVACLSGVMSDLQIRWGRTASASRVPSLCGVCRGCC